MSASTVATATTAIPSALKDAAGHESPERPESPEQSQARRWVNAPLDAGFAILDGWADYWVGATARGQLRADRFSPLGFAEDVAEWMRAATVRTKPEWVNRYSVKQEWPQARLLDFSAKPRSTMVPTLILPPQAGHASTIVDYSAEQSQVATAREAGLVRLYAMDWKAATEATKDSSIDTYVAILDEAVDHLGGRVNLVGDCQGGWLATIYAALRPEKINTLSMGGAPIDFHAGHSAIQEWVRTLRGRDELRFYKALVAMGGGNHLGESQIVGFKMLEPAQELDRIMQLWGHIRDEKYVSRHIDFTNWFEWGQAVPGAFYLWIVKHLFIHNELVLGQLTVDGEVADLSKITSPLFLLAGTTDHITPKEQQFALADHVSTPADQIQCELVEAGHLGLFMGRASLREHWAPLFAKVAELS